MLAGCGGSQPLIGALDEFAAGRRRRVRTACPDNLGASGRSRWASSVFLAVVAALPPLRFFLLDRRFEPFQPLRQLRRRA